MEDDVTNMRQNLIYYTTLYVHNRNVTIRVITQFDTISVFLRLLSLLVSYCAKTPKAIKMIEKKKFRIKLRYTRTHIKSGR